MKRNQRTLGVYAPLPGSASGIADYAAMTAAMLADVFEIDFISLDNYASPDTFDHVLYHMGCGRESAAAYRAMAIRPGPVILHEYVLSQFFIENHDLLDESTNAHVRAAFTAALGHRFTSSTELDDLMRRERERELHYLDLGLERLVVDRATTAFIHSTAALTSLRIRCGDKVQPLEFPSLPLPRSNRAETREALGIPESATLFGSFGFVGTHKRLSLLLRAWAELDIDPDVGHLLVVGQGTSALKPRAGRSTTLIEYLPSADHFAALLSAVDIGIQLRHPTLGETSGVASQLLAGDVPIIISTYSILPAWASNDLVCLVEPGHGEGDRLQKAITELLRQRPTGRRQQDDLRITSWRDTVLAALPSRAIRMAI